MPARKSESRKAWDQFEADMRTLGRDFRRHYEEGATGKAGDVQDSMRKLAEAAEEVFESLGRATRDPKVRDGTRKAAQSFGELIANAFRDLAGEVKSRRR
jgi:predicted phage gp36 major capsid-like protein